MRKKNVATALIASAALALTTMGASGAPAKAAMTRPANQVYYAEGTIRLVNEHNFCLTYPINPEEGQRIFWYPCTTLHGKPIDLQMWYTEKVLGVGSISMYGYPWVMGKSHTTRDLYARVWKLAEQPKMHFYTTFNIIFHNHMGWQAWMKIGPKVFVLSGPKGMTAKRAKIKPYYATLTNGSDLRKRFWGLDFVPGFKLMDQVPGR